MRSRVELFEKIRRDRRLDELSIRELADRHGVHRRTVRQALTAAVPPPRRVYPVRPRPAIDPWVTVIDAWLLADKDAPRKQRHTARRVWQRLVAEHQASLAEVTVSRYVARRRVELGLLTHEVSIPQTHLVGAEAEVDFGEFYSTIAGVVVKCWMFVMRLSHSGKAFHVAFATQAQEAFLEGHVLAFQHFGGVAGRVRYDNLKPAVVRVLKGRDRIGSERFTALRSHYGFDSFFCRPGIDGAHEKGGVEGEIGRFRRRHLVPKVASLGALNELIAAGDRLDDDRVITGRPVTIGDAFAIEVSALMGLPGEAFDCSTAVASDSTHFGSFDQNIFTEWHSRYGGRGVLIYWHVEKGSVVIHSQLLNCSASEVHAMVDGAIRHGTDMAVEANYVDTHGQSEIGFGITRLLGFDLLPRIKRINKVKLYRPAAGEPDLWPGLAPAMTRPIRWDRVGEQYDQMLKYATAIRVGTASTEAILRRFMKANATHPTYQAMIELGRAQKTIFLARYLRSRTLQREIHEGLNVVESWNRANNVIFYGKNGDLATNRRDEQEMSVLCLRILQAALVYVNTLMLQDILADPDWEDALTAEDERGLTPLFWSHVLPYGEVKLNMSSRLALGTAPDA
jgi:TnpA family transposase/transposase